MAQHSEYIDREVVKETEKAYLVKVAVNNRRDGMKTVFKWVAKSVCKPAEITARIEALPEEAKVLFKGKYVAVPVWIIGDAQW